VALAALCVVGLGASVANGAEGFVPMPPGLSTNTISHHLWKPVADDPYWQEIGQQIPTGKPVTAVAVYQESLYAVLGGGLKKLNGSALQSVSQAPAGVTRLRSVGDALWTATDHGTYRLASDKWEKVGDRTFTDFSLHLGQVYGATRDDLFRFEGRKFVSIRPPGGYLSSDSTLVAENFEQVLADPVQIGPVERIASYSGTLYMLRPGGLALLEGQTFVPDSVDWGMLSLPALSREHQLLAGVCAAVSAREHTAFTAHSESLGKELIIFDPFNEPCRRRNDLVSQTTEPIEWPRNRFWSKG
jgi:hypothetical protein